MPIKNLENTTISYSEQPKTLKFLENSLKVLMEFYETETIKCFDLNDFVPFKELKNKKAMKKRFAKDILEASSLSIDLNIYPKLKKLPADKRESIIYYSNLKI